MSLMTREQAEELAAKRERHKPRSMQHKRWQAVHTSTKGWHAALVDCPLFAEREARRKALSALQSGDTEALRRFASEALLARVRQSLDHLPPRQGGEG